MSCMGGAGCGGAKSTAKSNSSYTPKKATASKRSYSPKSMGATMGGLGFGKPLIGISFSGKK